MLTFILIILLISLVIRYLLPYLLPRLLTLWMHRQQRYYRTRQESTQPEGTINIRYKQKQGQQQDIHKHEGEYIDFEEIKDSN